MRDVYDYAKYFIKKGADTQSNTFDGNMKLQKMLFFADLISLAEKDEPLFDDNILAFANGCVVEKVRIRYKNDYLGFKEDSISFNPDFSQEEYEILNKTINLFGNLSARELSDLNHIFDFWSKSYDNGTTYGGYHEKGLSIVSVNDMRKEIGKILPVLSSYEKSLENNQCKETINGIDFYFDPKEILLEDEIINELMCFSFSAEDDSYSIYMDDGKLVIY